MTKNTMPRLAINLIALAISSAYPMMGAAADEATKVEPTSTEQAVDKSSNTKKTSNKVADNTDQTLPAVNVKSTSQQTQDGYQATKTRVGKVLQDPQDVPQAITTVTRSLMHDQQVGSLREALRNVSGLSFNAAEGGRSGDNFNLRGFYTFGDIYLDGIRDTAQYNRETFNLEQVDVLRGSAAMLFGRGQAGGVINQVSKIPQLQDKNTVTGSFGTNAYLQGTGDFNKQLTDTSAIRINVMHRDEENWRSNPASGTGPELHREGIALSYGLGLGTDDELILSHVYTKTRDVPDYGISFDGTTKKPTTRFPSSTFWGNGNNFDDSDTNVSTAVYTHKFSPDTQLRTQIRYGNYERAYWAKTPNLTAAPTASAGTGGNVTRTSDYKTTTVQSDLSTKFDLLGMKHEALAGVEYLHENSYRQGLLNLGTTAAPVYNADVVSGTPTRFKGNSYALYGQDTIEFIPDWKILFGARRDQLDADYSSTTSPSLSYGEWSYRSGLSWQPTKQQHYYLSYSDAFSPTADLYQLTVTPLPPETSKTVELGAKWLFLDGDLAFRTALYRTTKDWERNTDLEATSAILTKKRRTDGLEFELTGKITDNWEVFSGVSFMDAKILEPAVNVNATTGVTTYADPRLAGQTARNTPAATFNVWTTYEFVENWKIGGGVEAKGGRYGYQPGAATGPFTNGVFNPNRAPGYARMDAMVAYEQPKWAVRLNVFNLLDKVYYDSIYDNGGFTVPGNRRTAIVTTEFKF
ncbi:MAG: TonB-dependent receptor [Methylophilaceae bacterium]|jgi:catecholate siderophore receptor|nr:TonB-dependent siderophore receptor [Methyloradius sp.]